jgi:hypothetical protein
MDIPQANFLTASEFHRGPDLLRPGTLTGKNVDANAIAFIYTAFPYGGDESDILVSEVDAHFIHWPAAIGHEQMADRESVLKALFGAGFRDATAVVAYEREVYENDEQGNPKTTAEGDLIVAGKKVVYDSVELRRLAIQQNLFGRFGQVRRVKCLMLWNECERWREMLEKLLVLLQVPDEALVTMANTDQWWVKDYKSQVEIKEVQ